MIRKRISRKLVLLLLVCIGIIGLSWWLLFRQNNQTGTAYRFGTVRRGTLTVSTSVSGALIPKNQAGVTSPVAGIVTAVHVTPGAQVASGQALYEIESEITAADVAEAYASYVTARQRVEQARTNHLEAEAERARVAADPAANQEQKNAAQQAVVAAQAGITAAQQAQNAAWLAYDTLKGRSSKQTVRAPMEGTVTAVSVQVGAAAGGGRASGSAPGGNASEAASGPAGDVIISDLSRLQAQVEVNEVDVARITPGQKASLAYDAVDGLRLTGTVERVDSIGTDSGQGVVNFRAVIGLDGSDRRLRPGMTLSAVVTIDKKDNVLIAPLTAVKTEQDGRSYIETWSNDMAAKVYVKTGVSNDTEVEITGGIAENTRIITQRITPGTTQAANGSNPLGSTSGSGSGKKGK